MTTTIRDAGLPDPLTSPEAEETAYRAIQQQAIDAEEEHPSGTGIRHGDMIEIVADDTCGTGQVNFRVRVIRDGRPILTDDECRTALHALECALIALAV